MGSWLQCVDTSETSEEVDTKELATDDGRRDPLEIELVDITAGGTQSGGARVICHEGKCCIVAAACCS